MANVSSLQTSRSCSKCSHGKDKVNDIFTCHSCNQAFCWTHLTKHRQEILTHMDTIVYEHDLLKQELFRDHVKHPFLTQIDVWERESMAKIKAVAKAARIAAQNNQDQLKTAVKKFSDQLRSSRQDVDHLEMNLTKFRDKLVELQKEFETPSAVRCVEDDKTPPLRLIKVIEVIKETTPVPDVNPMVVTAGVRITGIDNIKPNPLNYVPTQRRVNRNDDGSESGNEVLR